MGTKIVGEIPERSRLQAVLTLLESKDRRKLTTSDTDFPERPLDSGHSGYGCCKTSVMFTLLPTSRPAQSAGKLNVAKTAESPPLPI